MKSTILPPAGRELDALIEEKVFGSQLSECRRFYGPPINQAIPEYSTNMGWAWKVVEKMAAKLRYKIAIETYDGKIFSIKPCGVSSYSPMEAICHAALSAIAHEEGE